ncbi:hypothetical protein UFOVP328_13 [uncultured Caudovirales phage]|uniref:Uncharacterized protein n=1 Tax=uncultured Caudovirales phage TaxID=2100421 RepID=A0A6J5LS96_9CAUD|nr:hypothetical protein UFOVP328_13 [uncultured Caudovirales phage]
MYSDLDNHNPRPTPYYPPKKRDWVPILKWLGVAMFIVGAVLNSVNIYPLNSVFLLSGGFIWAAVGHLTRDTAMVVLNLGMNAIYIAGLAWKLL